MSREDFNVKKLDVSIKTINDLFEDYLECVHLSSRQEKESLTIKVKMLNVLAALHSSLLKPVENKLQGKELIFVPDVQLAGIPFEALVSGRNQNTGQPVFLIEKYPIKYIQSASVLSYLRSRDKRDKNEKINSNLVAFGDPVYDYGNFKKGKPEYKKYPRLSYSGKEVEAVVKLFQEKGQRPVVYLREKATEANAKAPGMNRFGYIHFACHGTVGDNFSNLVLSLIPGKSEDGFFSFGEIMNCNYNAQLVVLSACQTNLGKKVKGEGVAGLLQAVMYTGVPAAVASLWRVKDTAAEALMVRFYENLLEKRMEKTEALRQAKLSLLKSKAYASPVHWSAFLMYGE